MTVGGQIQLKLNKLATRKENKDDLKEHKLKDIILRFLYNICNIYIWKKVIINTTFTKITTRQKEKARNGR